MKKYKLYRSCKKNVLLKNIVNFRRLNNWFNEKMAISVFFSCIGMLCVRCKADEFDNKFVNIAYGIVFMTGYMEIIFFILDAFNLLQSEEKINNLDRLLNEKDIDFDFYGALSIEYYDDDDYVFIKDKDGKRIISYSNDDIIYRDMDKRIDITDDVKKALLPNKKKRKNK